MTKPDPLNLPVLLQGPQQVVIEPEAKPAIKPPTPPAEPTMPPEEPIGRYTVPREDAQVRPGERAPWREEGELPEISGSGLPEILRQTRELFRVARNPHNDPLWHRLRPVLRDWEQALLAERHSGPELPELAEIRRYLCHPTPAPVVEIPARKPAMLIQEYTGRWHAFEDALDPRIDQIPCNAGCICRATVQDWIWYPSETQSALDLGKESVDVNQP